MVFTSNISTFKKYVINLYSRLTFPQSNCETTIIHDDGNVIEVNSHKIFLNGHSEGATAESDEGRWYWIVLCCHLVKPGSSSLRVEKGKRGGRLLRSDFLH